MSHTGRHSTWELLLNEPIALVASVRCQSESGAAVSTLRGGTAVLTESRFVYVGRTRPSRPPKSRELLNKRIRFVFLRSNITEITRIQENSDQFILRYYEGSEKKVRLIPGNGGEVLINQLEQDLSRG
jgi:hypothetical protein